MQVKSQSKRWNSAGIWSQSLDLFDTKLFPKRLVSDKLGFNVLSTAQGYLKAMRRASHGAGPRRLRKGGVGEGGRELKGVLHRQ